jgi:hypothetical protein
MYATWGEESERVVFQQISFIMNANEKRDSRVKLTKAANNI